MLTYTPETHKAHCIFRMVRLLAKLPPGKYALELLLLLDFYLAFPDALARFQMPQSLGRAHKKVAATRQKYAHLENAHYWIDNLRPIQLDAISELAARGLIDHEELKSKRVRHSEAIKNSVLHERIESANARESILMELLTDTLPSLYEADRVEFWKRTQLS